jgi:hypothetical protein
MVSMESRCITFFDSMQFFWFNEFLIIMFFEKGSFFGQWVNRRGGQKCHFWVKGGSKGGSKKCQFWGVRKVSKMSKKCIFQKVSKNWYYIFPKTGNFQRNVSVTLYIYRIVVYTLVKTHPYTPPTRSKIGGQNMTFSEVSFWGHFLGSTFGVNFWSSLRSFVNFESFYHFLVNILIIKFNIIKNSIFCPVTKSKTSLELHNVKDNF